MKPQIPWLRVGVEGAVIVGSILLAFGIDAAWDERGERRAQAEQIATLRSEFRTARGTLESDADALEEAGRATNELLALMGPLAPSPDRDEVLTLLIGSFNMGTAVPSHTVLDGVLASGNPRVMAGDPLGGMLGRWPEMMGALAVDGDHLERNRDVDLQAALVEIGIPGFAAAASASELGLPGLPPSAFPADTDRMVRSVGVYAGLYYRAFRITVLLGSVRSTIETADAIIGQLDALSGPVAR